MHVVVVGGGICGMTVAYYLSRERDVSVTLCEQGKSIGHGSTPRAAGGMRSLFSTPTHIALSLKSLQVWHEFESKYDLPIDFKNTGYLFGVRSRTLYESIRKDLCVQKQLGASTELLSPQKATEFIPGLNTDLYLAIAWDPQAAVCDPSSALQAYAQLATENGVTILTEHKVTNITQDHTNRVTGVEINGGEKHLDAEYVVNAAGPWGHRIAEMAGVEVPITPKKRADAIIVPSSTVPDSLPHFTDLNTGVHFRPWDGNVLAGGHFANKDPDVDPDASSSYQDHVDLRWGFTVMDKLTEVATYFDDTSRLKSGWSGVYAITRSNHPIIEESVPGFVNNVGHSGRAFMHAPATGQIVAEIIVDGYVSLIDDTVLKTDNCVDRRGPLPIPYRKDSQS